MMLRQGFSDSHTHSPSEMRHQITYSRTLLRCLQPGEAAEVLIQIHDGVYGNHVSVSALVIAIIHQGYWWPTIAIDAKEYTKMYHAYQFHSNMSKRLAIEMQHFSPPGLGNFQRNTRF